MLLKYKSTEIWKIIEPIIRNKMFYIDKKESSKGVYDIQMFERN